MTVQFAPQSKAIHSSQPMVPYTAKTTEIQPEAPGVATYWLKFEDEAVHKGYTFHPGQFNTLILRMNSSD